MMLCHQATAASLRPRCQSAHQRFVIENSFGERGGPGWYRCGARGLGGGLLSFLEEQEQGSGEERGLYHVVFRVQLWCVIKGFNRTCDDVAVSYSGSERAVVQFTSRLH